MTLILGFIMTQITCHDIKAVSIIFLVVKQEVISQDIQQMLCWGAQIIRLPGSEENSCLCHDLMIFSALM